MYPKLFAGVSKIQNVFKIRVQNPQKPVFKIKNISFFDRYALR